MDLIQDTFVKCDSILRNDEGFLKNATNGGQLEVLERVSFKDLIEQDGSKSNVV